MPERQDWSSRVRQTIHLEAMAWRESCQQLDRLFFGEASFARTPEIEDAIAEMVRHAETLLAAVRDLPRAAKLDAQLDAQRRRKRR